MEKLNNVGFQRYIPSKKQIELLGLLLSPDCPDTIGQQAEEINVKPHKISKWLHNSYFVEWLNRSIAIGMANKLHFVWRAILNTAVQGNVAAQKLFLERFDPEYCPQIKAELINTDKKEVIINVDTVRLKELAKRFSDECSINELSGNINELQETENSSTEDKTTEKVRS